MRRTPGQPAGDGNWGGRLPYTPVAPPQALSTFPRLYVTQVTFGPSAGLVFALAPPGLLHGIQLPVRGPRAGLKSDRQWQVPPPRTEFVLAIPRVCCRVETILLGARNKDLKDAH